MSTVNGSWARPKIVNDGLVLYLDANAPNSYSPYFTPTTWKDLSGNNNSGSLINGPTFSSATGGGIVFDGVDDYVGVGKVNAMSSFTLSFWFNITSFLGESRFLYISNNSQSPGFRPENGSNKLVWWDGNITPGVYGVGTTTLQTNTIYNATYVRNNTTGIKTIYLNAQIEFTGAAINTFQNVDFSQGIGFNGKIFSTLIYNKALTSDEILQNYNATKGRYGL